MKIDDNMVSWRVAFDIDVDFYGRWSIIISKMKGDSG